MPTGSAAVAAVSLDRVTHERGAYERIDEVRELQARIRSMQATKLDTRSLETAPTVAGLLPGGSLKTGVAYAIEGSTSLAMALMAGPSQAGA